jgi:hypothetical protein
MKFPSLVFLSLPAFALANLGSAAGTTTVSDVERLQGIKERLEGRNVGTVSGDRPSSSALKDSNIFNVFALHFFQELINDVRAERSRKTREPSTATIGLAIARSDRRLQTSVLSGFITRVSLVGVLSGPVRYTLAPNNAALQLFQAKSWILYQPTMVHSASS